MEYTDFARTMDATTQKLLENEPWPTSMYASFSADLYRKSTGDTTTSDDRQPQKSADVTESLTTLLCADNLPALIHICHPAPSTSFFMRVSAHPITHACSQRNQASQPLYLASCRPTQQYLGRHPSLDQCRIPRHFTATEDCFLFDTSQRK